MGRSLKLPFQECGTTFLANLGVRMAWVFFFFPQFDTFHMSQGPKFCTLQPLMIYREFIYFFSVMHSICPRDLNSAPCNPYWYTGN